MSQANESTPSAGQGPKPAGAETGITATPPPVMTTAVTADAPTIPLPAPRPAPPPLSPERAQRRLDLFDMVLVVLMLALAGLAAAFPVRNSDFWLHLAVGRGIANGEFGPTAEPFSYTAPATWVNHSWLYGLLTYGAFSSFGGSTLIVLKAIGIAVLALLLVQIRRRDGGLWLPVVCTVVAIVAMVPRLLLQPVVVSYLFLGITLFLLLRRENSREVPPADKKKPRSLPPPPWSGEPADRILWLLVPLFALWANLDSWFLLGPATVALVLVGQILQERLLMGVYGPPRPGTWRPLVLILGAGLVACVLNPHHINAFRLPTEIGQSEVANRLMADDLFRRIFTSPWSTEFIDRETKSIAGIAYFLLVGISTLSFIVNREALAWSRVLVWLGGMALAVLNARAVPFFAIVAAPVAVLNFQEYAKRTWGVEVKPGSNAWQWSLGGRFLTTLALAVLLVLTWPGWLFSFTSDARRVGLTAEPDPSLVKTAELLRSMRQSGELTGNGFNVMPEVANVLAWLSPADMREKGFFDFRLGLYSPEIAEDYVRLRHVLLGRRGGSQTDVLSPTELDALLRKYDVSYLVFHDADTGRTDQLVLRHLAEPRRWVPLHLDGRTGVFGVVGGSLERPELNPLIEHLRTRPGFENLPAPSSRRSPDTRFAKREYDAGAAAFGPEAKPLIASKAPDQSMRPWYDLLLAESGYRVTPVNRSAEADEARMLLLAYFQAQRYDWHYEKFMVPWGAASAACMVGQWMTGLPPFGSPVGASMTTRIKMQLEAPQLDVLIGPIAPALLALRRSREAIAASPFDPRSHAWLGQAARTLRWDTSENGWGQSLQQLSILRQAQIAAAFQAALQLEPDRAVQVLCHDGLSQLYRLLGYRDLAYKHLSEKVRLDSAGEPLPNEDDARFKERIEAMGKALKQVEKDLRTRENEYAVKASGKPTLEKASIALDLGLADRALQVLLNALASDFGNRGIRLQLDLLLSMGDVTRLRFFLTHKDNIETMQMNFQGEFGFPLYEMYRMQLAVLEGDYKEADDFLEKAIVAVSEGGNAVSYGRRTLFFPTGLSPMDDRVPVKDIPAAAKLAPRQLAAVGVAQAIAGNIPEPGPVMWLVERWKKNQRVLLESTTTLVPLMQQCDLYTLRGILAAESGEIEAARRHLRQALYLDTQSKEPVLEFGGRGAAEGYLELIEKQRK